MIEKVVSGGQTGVDRAALDAAMATGLKVGGWCPAGRRAEDGPIDEIYPLIETRTKDYRTRTRWNVRDSDATLILCYGEPSGGTALTVNFSKELNKPFLVCAPEVAEIPRVQAWLASERISVLNIAGPRERRSAPIYSAARNWVNHLLGIVACR